MTNPRPDVQEPREGMRAPPDLPLSPLSPISPVYDQESSSMQTSPSLSTDDSCVGSPVSDLSVSDSSYNDQVAPCSSPETYQCSGRRGFSVEQLRVISSFYEATPYPSSEQYQQFSTSLSMDSKSIKLWFQNQRSKARKQLSRELEAPHVSSDDDDVDIESVRIKMKHDVKPIIMAPVDKTSSPAQYKEMTLMSLPADHPFCQLLPPGPLNRRLRRPAARPRPSVDSPLARPPYARGRSKNPKDAHNRMNTPPRVAPPATVVFKPEVARLWRPIDDPPSTSTPSSPQQAPIKQQRPPSASSPLDLSVSLKRKRDSTAATMTSGDAMDASFKTHAGEMSGVHPAALPASYPMMFPGAFPFYGHPAGGAYIPVMPHMSYPMPHLPMPAMGAYGQSLSMWGGGMRPAVPEPQKPVR